MWRELGFVSLEVGKAKRCLSQIMTDKSAPRYWWITGGLAVFVLLPALMLIALLRGIGFEGIA